MGLLLSIVEVHRITVSVVVRVSNTFKRFNMNETKKVYLFSMLPIGSFIGKLLISLFVRLMSVA